MGLRVREVIGLEHRSYQLGISSENLVQKLTRIVVVVPLSIAQSWRRIVEHLSRVNWLKQDELVVCQHLEVLRETIILAVVIA